MIPSIAEIEDVGPVWRIRADLPNGEAHVAAEELQETLLDQLPPLLTATTPALPSINIGSRIPFPLI